MPGPVVLTPPTVAGVPLESVVLSPNRGDDLELVGGTSGVVLAQDGNEGLFPVPEFEEEYAFSRTTEGGLRTQSRPTIVRGEGHAWLLGSNGADVGTLEWRLERALEDSRRSGGQLIVAPAEGERILYQVTSARLASETYTPPRRRQGVGEATFEISYLPFAHLDELEVDTTGGSGPIVTLTIPELPGSADALGELEISDAAGIARYFVEGGLEARYFDPFEPWPVLIDSDDADMDKLEGADVESRAGAYSSGVYRQNLGSAQTGVTTTRVDQIGRFRVKARFFATELAEARTAVGVRGGQPSFRPWKALPLQDGWTEVDLGLIAIDPPSSGNHFAYVSVYARAESGTGTIDLDYIKLIPAERYFRAHGEVGGGGTTRANSGVRIRWDGIETQATTNAWTRHPRAIGPGLRIPRTGGRLAFSLIQNDVTTEEHIPVSGQGLDATLRVIPRVVLRGAGLIH